MGSCVRLGFSFDFIDFWDGNYIIIKMGKVVVPPRADVLTSLIANGMAHAFASDSVLTVIDFGWKLYHH